MIYRIVMVSDEVQDFRRDFRIEGTASFKALNDIILESVGYSDSELTSFFVTDKRWRPKQEILLIDMGLGRSDQDIYLMESTYLDDFLEDEGDRLLFNFDQLGDRYFYLELKEVILGESLDAPEVVRAVGDAPRQTSDVEELLAAPTLKKAIGAKGVVPEEELEQFDSEGFDMDEIDVEGFDITEE